MVKRVIDQKKKLRQFSLGLAGLLVFIGVVNFLMGGRSYLYLLPAAAIALLIGLLVPGWMKPLFWLMTRIGNVLNWIVTNLVLALLFYLVFTIIGLILRFTGNRPLAVEFKDRQGSYWIKREEPEFRGEGFERQY